MATQTQNRELDSSSPVQFPQNEPSDQVAELYLRAFVDSHSGAVAVLSETGEILYANRGWRDFALQQGQAADYYAVGSNYLLTRLGAADAAAGESREIANGVSCVLRGQQTEYHEEYLNRSTLDRRWIRVHAARFDLPRACRVLITHEDITESKQTVEHRQKAAEHLRRLLDATRILPWEADADSRQYTYVGEQAVKVLGYPVEDWYRTDFWARRLHPEDRDRVIASVNDFLRTRDNYELECRMVAKDGHTVWLHNVVSVSRQDGRAKTVRGFSIDISESKEREAALRALSGRLIDAQEEERRRVARELHDDLNQRMALLSIEIEQLGQMFGNQAELDKRLGHLKAQAREISADIHRLSYKLHPSKLDHLGLAAAVRSLCEELSGSGQIDVDLLQSGFPAILPPDVTLCLFRVTQEALHNSVKHSGANVVKVNLHRTHHGISLNVSDDGSGFNPESEVMKKGLGFTSMRERLRLVNGRMNIHSQPGRGTRIEVSIPLPDQNEGIDFNN
jgi:PAS domain S-box-containing protein